MATTLSKVVVSSFKDAAALTVLGIAVSATLSFPIAASAIAYALVASVAGWAAGFSIAFLVGLFTSMFILVLDYKLEQTNR